jgi:glycosyltransferase involved in cell wall biosynthesis
MIEELRSLVKEEKMEDHISVLGYISDAEIPAFFNEADIFFLPGTGGLAVNEAMAYGLTVITTIADGTVLDLVYEGKNGYYLKDIPDFDNLYEVCKKALQNSKSHLREMGNASRQIVMEKASLSNMVSNFEKAVVYGMENPA